eukprot:gene16799-42836_t
MVVTKMTMCLREAAHATLRLNPHQPNIVDNIILIEKKYAVKAQPVTRAVDGNLATAAFLSSCGGGKSVFRGPAGPLHRGRGGGRGGSPPAVGYLPYQPPAARGSGSGSRERGTSTTQPTSRDLEMDEQRLEMVKKEKEELKEKEEEDVCFPKCFPLFSLCTRAGLAPGVGPTTVGLADTPEPALAAAPITPRARDRAPAVTGMETGTQYQIDTIAAQHKKRALNGNIRAKRGPPPHKPPRTTRARRARCTHTQLYQVDTVARQHRVRAMNGNIVYGGHARPRYGQYGYNPRRNPYSYDPYPVERRGQGQKGRSPRPELRPGDFMCTRCTFHNYSRNTECHKCGAPRPGRPPHQSAPGKWRPPAQADPRERMDPRPDPARHPTRRFTWKQFAERYGGEAAKAWRNAGQAQKSPPPKAHQPKNHSQERRYCGWLDKKLTRREFLRVFGSGQPGQGDAEWKLAPRPGEGGPNNVPPRLRSGSRKPAKAEPENTRKKEGHNGKRLVEPRPDPARHESRRFTWQQFVSHHGEEGAKKAWRKAGKALKRAAKAEKKAPPNVKKGDKKGGSKKDGGEKKEPGKENKIEQTKRRSEQLRRQVEREKGRAAKLEERLTRAKEHLQQLEKEQQEASYEELSAIADGDVEMEGEPLKGAPPQDAAAEAKEEEQLKRAMRNSMQTHEVEQEKFREGIEALREKAKAGAKKVKDVDKDGHCQPRAIARQLRRRGLEVTHVQVRAAQVNWLRKNKGRKVGTTVVRDFIEGDYDAYVTAYERGEWGDHLTLLAAGCVYAAVIRVWSSLASAPHPTEHVPIDPAVTPKRELTLGHICELHWTSIEDAAPEPSAAAPTPSAQVEDPTKGKNATWGPVATEEALANERAKVEQAEQAKAQLEKQLGEVMGNLGAQAQRLVAAEREKQAWLERESARAAAELQRQAAATAAATAGGGAPAPQQQQPAAVPTPGTPKAKPPPPEVPSPGALEKLGVADLERMAEQHGCTIPAGPANRRNMLVRFLASFRGKKRKEPDPSEAKKSKRDERNEAKRRRPANSGGRRRLTSHLAPRLRRRCGHAAVRVGEAKNPGPPKHSQKKEQKTRGKRADTTDPARLKMKKQRPAAWDKEKEWRNDYYKKRFADELQRAMSTEGPNVEGAVRIRADETVWDK